MSSIVSPAASIPPAAAPSAPTTKATKGESALGNMNYNAFLKLLVEQLKNQDPTEPMDSTQYMEQLASFANVEQNIKTNARLDAVLAATSVTQAGALIGRNVTSADGAISGKVTGYEIFADGVKLLLESGARLALGPGVKVTGQ